MADVLQELGTISKKPFMWFTDNEMMANADKLHFLLSSDENYTIEINGFTVKNLTLWEILRVRFYKQLKFEFFIEKICKNANREIHALARVHPYMVLSVKRILINAFFDSKFNYCYWSGCVIN